MRLSWILEGRLAASGMIGGEDVERLLELGVRDILSLTVRSPFPGGAPGGVRHLHLPVPDMTCPVPADLDRAIAFLTKAAQDGRAALVHCGAGYGRTGTVAACYLVSGGMDPEDAIRAVRTARPGAIETFEQESGIRAFAGKRKEAPGA